VIFIYRKTFTLEKYMLLKNGSRGEDVIALQRRLGITADGSFGPMTERAVREWQRTNAVHVDGIVKLDMWNALFPKTPEASINLGKLKIPANVISQIPEVMDKFKINTPLRIAHFLAQCGHESGGFKVTTENLNYSAQGLLSTFRKYFPTEALANQYARQPEKIANLVYANRMNNGNEASGDGWRFRGRGYIQLTGRDNYTRFNREVPEDILVNPDLVATKYPLLSAAWFWNSRNLNLDSDRGSSIETVTQITRKVNGGTIGLQDRIKHFNEYYSLLI
jgi:putative chitinase